MNNPFDKKEPFKPTFEKVEEVTTPQEDKEERIAKKRADRERAEKFEILQEYGMLESNIPITHRYWSLKG